MPVGDSPKSAGGGRAHRTRPAATRVLVTFLVAALWAVSGTAQAALSLRGAKVLAGQIEPVDDTHWVASTEGAAISLGHGAVLRARPGARFRFGRTVKLPLRAGPDPMVFGRSVVLDEGRLDISMPEQEPLQWAVVVSAPLDVRLINRGGSSSIRVAEDRVSIAAWQGTQLSSSGFGWMRLPAGNTRLYSKYYPKGYKRALIEPPGALRADRRLLRDSGGKADLASLSWEAVKGASSYQMEVAQQAEASPLQTRNLSETTAEVLGLPPGAYVVRVRAIDSSGFAGAWSEPLGLNVVGLRVPQGAAVARDGTFRLPRGMRVELVGAEGLEIAYSGIDEFLPAPHSLGLVGQRPVTAKLRHPQTREVLEVSMAPMNIFARVRIDPSPERWPREGLAVSLRLEDEAGFAVPDDFRFEVRASVNLVPVEPSWRREAGQLETRLGRPPGRGPWVVRLSVFDAAGQRIGGDVLDVGYRSAAR